MFAIFFGHDGFDLSTLDRRVDELDEPFIKDKTMIGYFGMDFLMVPVIGDIEGGKV